MAIVLDEIEWWRAKSHENECLYRKQKEISEGYKGLLLELSEKRRSEVTFAHPPDDYVSPPPIRSYPAVLSIKK